MPRSGPTPIGEVPEGFVKNLGDPVGMKAAQMANEKLRENSERDRIIELEKREEGTTLKGDFEGSVTGKWEFLDEATGAGMVRYKGKIYRTQPQGFVSVPRGTKVELTFADGIYYSKY